MGRAIGFCAPREAAVLSSVALAFILFLVSNSKEASLFFKENIQSQQSLAILMPWSAISSTAKRVKRKYE
jgi:hypothetical protein